jgi:hypothetical protein
MKTRHEIEEACQHPDLLAAVEQLMVAESLKKELAAERHESVAKFVAYELAATQWARASNKFEALLREALA